MDQKILDINTLAAKLEEARADGQRIVHCHGCFDLLHYGHIRHLQLARSFGDLLVVTVTPNQFVNKGPHRPAFDERLRCETLANLESVDFVALNRWPTAIESIDLLRPDFFVKGSEFADLSTDVTGAVAKEAAAVQSIGGQMVFTDDVTFSSSNLINRFLPTISKQAIEFIGELGPTYAPEDVVAWLDNARKLRVLVIGEAIIDEYSYCETLGAEAKEPILSVRLESSERFAGGALAVANHVSAFSEQTSLISMIGELQSCEEFIQESISDRVCGKLLPMPGMPTIVKQRFIENYPFQKLFEVCVMDGRPLGEATRRALIDGVAEQIGDVDLVLVSDYGHGMLHEDAVELICDKAKKLAIRTPINAGNQGFNAISRYPRADFVFTSEKELLLESRRQGDLEPVVSDVAARLGAEEMLITRGAEGICHYRRDEGFCRAPALVDNYADRLGAAEAMFAAASLCMAQSAPPAVTALIANAVGGIAVRTIGNPSPLSRTELVRFLVSLFK